MKEQQVHICFMLCRCRTGSTTLNKAISIHDRAIVFSEIFNSVHKHSYQKYLVDRLGENRVFQERFLNEGPLFAFDSYITYLLEVSKTTKPNLEYFIFECKIENIQVFGDIWTHPGGDFGTVSIIRRALAIADSVIFLRRLNVFERYLSALAAQSTGIFHSNQGSQTKSGTMITGNPKATVSALKGEVDFDNRLQDYLMRVVSKLYLPTYEQIYHDNQFTEDFIKSFSNNFGGITLNSPKLTKVRTMSGRDLITNYDELYNTINNIPELKWMVKTQDSPDVAT